MIRPGKLRGRLGESSLRAITVLIGITVCLAETVWANDQKTNDTGRGIVSGTIVDADESPIERASVVLYRYEQKSWRWGYMEKKGTPAVSDRTGTFQFPGLENGEYWIAANHSDFGRSISKTRYNQSVKVVLKPAAAVIIEVKDQAGNPVAGARVREFSQRGVNGQFRLHRKLLDRLDFVIPLSDEAGRIRLTLPVGEIISNLTIDHPAFVASRIDELTVSRDAKTEVTLRPGVSLTLKTITEDQSDHISSAEIELQHQSSTNPATMIGCAVSFDNDGIARLTVEPGEYRALLLDHNDFCLVPNGQSLSGAQPTFRIEQGHNDRFEFDVRRKVPVRGRVIDSRTGQPIPGVFLGGELANSPAAKGANTENRQWTTIVTIQAKTNDQGEYAMQLAKGLARVTLFADTIVADSEHVECTVAADGSTIIPDIKTGPVPKVLGTVLTPDDKPAPNIVVSIRTKLFNTSPVLTNENGEFEIQPQYLPTDPDTGKRIDSGDVIAFDPYGPVGAIAKTRIDKPERMVLKLEQHDVSWPMSEFNDRLADYERGIVPVEQATRDAAISLRGRVPPELDGALWLNTDGGKPIKLDDLRGKYVLLDFWFTTCTPCRLDYPSVKLVHELYKDRGLVVIGIHNNRYKTLETVREYVVEKGMSFPVVVDSPDGRLIDRFQKHGIANGFPNYVLLDPNGKVLLDDSTIPHPALYGYKLEIIRSLLIQGSP